MNQLIRFPLRAERAAWPLVLVASEETSPRRRRVSLIGECLAGYVYRPGQDLMVSLPGGARRRYAICGYDATELRLDIEVPADGASGWAETAEIGDPVVAEGPRRARTRRRDPDLARLIRDELRRIRRRSRISGWARA